MIKKVGVQFILALVFLFGISTSLKAQPGNLPAPYCMPLYGQSPCNQPGPSNMPGNFLNDFIHSVLTFSGNVDINNPNTGCNAQIFPSIGIKNYIYHKCQHNLSVSAGQVVSFSIQIGNINPQGVAAFIDWNNDNIFSTAPTEKIGWSTGTVPAGGWLTFTTTIPPAQTNGTYRLRVRCAFGISGATIDPCNNYSCGEVEDYDVYVGTTSPVISNVVASSNSTLCSGNTLSLNLTYTSQCSPSYTWAGPNSFVSNSQNPTIVNAQPLHSGNYSLTVTCGTACPVSLTTSVTVVQGPTPANAGGNQCICATTATLNGNIPSIGTGSWTLLSGSAIIITPTLANTALFSVGVGTNIFAWTITNGTCVSSSTVAIIRGMPPSVSVAGPNQTLTCSGNTTTMQANAPAIGIGTWSLISGSGIFVSPNSPSTAVTGVGSGTNIYMWVISGGCCSGPASTSTLTVVNILSISVNVTNTSSLACAGFSVQLTGNGATNYTWTGTTFTGNIISPSVFVPSGSYTVVGATGLCTSTDAIVIGTTTPISINLAQSSLTVCPGVNSILTATGASNYNWNPCIGLSSCNTSSAFSSPSVTIQYTITGTTAACSATSAITVSFVPGPTVSALASPTLICSGDQATLTASGAVNYTWATIGSGSNVTVSPVSSTIYTVTGSDVNQCTNKTTLSLIVSLCTEITESSLNEFLQVFPNPFKDELKIVSTRNIQIKLLDVTGKEILRREVDAEILINTSQFAKGVYFIHFTKETSLKPVKVIKD